MVERGHKICPLFAVFGVTNDIFRFDWLHSVDQGIGADFLGNLFEMVLPKLPGNNKPARCKSLWLEMESYYEKYDVKDRMKGFSYNNLRSSMDLAPKLHGGNAASCRALIQFGHLLAQEHLDSNVPLEAAAKDAAYHLFLVYQTLSATTVFRHEVMEESSRKFALLYGSLRDLSQDPLWRVKPKLHLFLEMCSEDCVPSLFWTYRDEDFGGSVGHQSKMRGSWCKTSAYMKHALDLFALKNQEPRMVGV